LGHIQAGFYENADMHGAKPVPMDTWLKDTDWDEQRRFNMVKCHATQQKIIELWMWGERIF
jgi:hypothetical protein